MTFLLGLGVFLFYLLSTDGTQRSECVGPRLCNMLSDLLKSALPAKVMRINTNDMNYQHLANLLENCTAITVDSRRHLRYNLDCREVDDNPGFVYRLIQDTSTSYSLARAINNLQNGFGEERTTTMRTAEKTLTVGVQEVTMNVGSSENLNGSVVINRWLKNANACIQSVCILFLLLTASLAAISR